jgi:hypothetical protein
VGFLSATHMQKLALKNFEFSINANTWSAAQDLAHQGCVSGLQEVERNFWVAKVRDDEFVYEAEVMITPSKIKAYACGCWTEQRRLMCSHIAATLLKLRQYLQHKAEEKVRQVEATAPEDKTRIAIGDILDEVPAEAMREFIRMYARRDRDFNLALKTWFAGSLTIGGENPYLLVLDSVLPKNALTAPLREPDYRRLRRTVGDLEDQLATAQVEGNVRSVFLLSGAIFQRISPLVGIAEEPRKGALLRDADAALQHLMRLSQQTDIAAELRDAAWKTIFDSAQNEIIPTDMHRDIIRFLAQSTHDRERFEYISAAWFEQPTENPSTLLFHAWLAALAVRGMNEGVVKMLSSRFEGIAKQPEQVQLARRAILELYYLQYDAAAMASIKWLLEEGELTVAYRRELEELQLQLAERSGDRKIILPLLRQRFVLNGQTGWFDRLKTMAGAEWPAELQKLLDELRSAKKEQQIAVVLAAEGDTKALASWLATTDDLALMQRYEHLLENDFLEQQYVRLLVEYLQDHMGQPALAHLREVLGRLIGKGRKVLVINILNRLNTHYPDREGLSELGQDLFKKKM